MSDQQQQPHQQPYQKREEQSSSGGIFRREEEEKQAKSALPTPSKGPISPKNVHHKWEHLHLNWKQTVTPETPQRNSENNTTDTNNNTDMNMNPQMLNLSPLSTSTAPPATAHRIPSIDHEISTSSSSASASLTTPDFSFKPYGSTPSSRGARTSRLEAYTSMSVYDRLYRQANIPPSPKRTPPRPKPPPRSPVSSKELGIPCSAQLRMERTQLVKQQRLSEDEEAEAKTASNKPQSQSQSQSQAVPKSKRVSKIPAPVLKFSGPKIPPSKRTIPKEPPKKKRPWKSPSRVSILSKTNPFAKGSKVTPVGGKVSSPKTTTPTSKTTNTTTAKAVVTPTSTAASATAPKTPTSKQRQRPWKSPTSNSQAASPVSTTPSKRTPNNNKQSQQRPWKSPSRASVLSKTSSPFSSTSPHTGKKPLTTYQIRKLASQKLKERQKAEAEAKANPKPLQEETTTPEKTMSAPAPAPAPASLKKTPIPKQKESPIPEFNPETPTRQRLSHPMDTASAKDDLTPPPAATSSPPLKQTKEESGGSKTPPSLDLPSLKHKISGSGSTVDSDSTHSSRNPIVEAVQAVRSNNNDNPMVLLQSASLAIKRFQATAVLQRWWRGTLARKELETTKKIMERKHKDDEDQRYVPKSPVRHYAKPKEPSTPLSPATAAGGKGTVQSAYRESHASVEQKHEFVHIYRQEHDKYIHDVHPTTAASNDAMPKKQQQQQHPQHPQQQQSLQDKWKATQPMHQRDTAAHRIQNWYQNCHKQRDKQQLHACRTIMKAWRQYRQRFELHEEKRKAAEMLQLCWWRELSHTENERIKAATSESEHAFSKIPSDIRQFVCDSREALEHEQKGSQMLQLCWWRPLSEKEQERISKVPKVTKYSKMPGQVKDFIVSMREERAKNWQAAFVLQRWWRAVKPVRAEPEKEMPESKAQETTPAPTPPTGKLVKQVEKLQETSPVAQKPVVVAQTPTKLPEQKSTGKNLGSALRGIQHLAKQSNGTADFVKKDTLKGQKAAETASPVKETTTKKATVAFAEVGATNAVNVAKDVKRKQTVKNVNETKTTKQILKDSKVVKKEVTVKKVVANTPAPKAASNSSIDMLGIYRQAFRVRKNELLKKRNRRVKAARTIEQWWTMSCLVRRFLGQRKVASIRIQTVYRGYSYYMVYYILQCKVIMVQRWWRLCRSGKVHQYFKKSKRTVWRVSGGAALAKRNTAAVKEATGSAGSLLQQLKLYFAVMALVVAAFALLLFVALVYVDGIISVKHESF